MAYTELCGGVHTPQRQRPMQIPVGFCTHFIGTRVDHGLGLCQCERTVTMVNSHCPTPRPTKNDLYMIVW